MNESSEHDKLNRLLEDWSQRRQTPQDQDTLQQGILDAWEQERQTPVTQSPVLSTATTKPTIQHSLVWFALGVAASVLVTVFLLPRRDEPTASAPTPGTPSEGWIGVEQKADKLKLLQEVERMFGDRLAWIAETPNGMQLEILDEATTGDATRTNLAVRVVVVRRATDDAQWIPVWTADLVTRAEQSIRFSPTSDAIGGETEFSLWAYRVDHDVISVDSSLILSEMTHPCVYSGAQRSEVPTVVASFQQDGDEFRVFQTVAILGKEA